MRSLPQFVNGMCLTLKGYDTCSIIARVSRNADELSDADQDIAIEAINEPASSTSWKLQEGAEG